MECRCPGERRPISEAVHLGRLARFHPACRGCRHRDRCRVRDEQGHQVPVDQLPLPAARDLRTRQSDALLTLALVLRLLSQSDRPLSEVLDAEAVPA